MPEKDVTLTTAATEYELVPYEVSRIILMITNTHSSAIIKVTTQKGESASGFRLYPRSIAVIQTVDGDKPEKRYFAQSDTNTTVVNIHEEFAEREEVKKKVAPKWWG